MLFQLAEAFIALLGMNLGVVNVTQIWSIYSQPQGYFCFNLILTLNLD